MVTVQISEVHAPYVPRHVIG